MAPGYSTRILRGMTAPWRNSEPQARPKLWFRKLWFDRLSDADDLHGTILEEMIFHMAGATLPQLQTEAAMVKAIREAGRVPAQRNTFYEPIKVWESSPAANDTEPLVCKSKVLEDNLASA